MSKNKWIWSEILKRRETFMELLGDFLNKKHKRFKLSDGYSIIPEDYFKEKIEPVITFDSSIIDLKFLYSNEIPSRIGKPGSNVMGVDKDGLRGNYDYPRLCPPVFGCNSCKKKMQIIQHEIILTWDDNYNALQISIMPKITCPHCDQQVEVSKSGVFVIH